MTAAQAQCSLTEAAKRERKGCVRHWHSAPPTQLAPLVAGVLAGRHPRNEVRVQREEQRRRRAAPQREAAGVRLERRLDQHEEEGDRGRGEELARDGALAAGLRARGVNGVQATASAVFVSARDDGSHRMRGKRKKSMRGGFSRLEGEILPKNRLDGAGGPLRLCSRTPSRRRRRASGGPRSR